MRLPLFLVAVLAVVVTGCASSGAVPRPFPGARTTPTAPPAAPVTPTSPVPPTSAAPPPVEAGTPTATTATPTEAIIATALDLRGVRYRNGGSDPTGFDCSGFMQWVFGRHGIVLPREVSTQFEVGDRIDRTEVKPGDLVFFETVSRGATHVGLVIAPDEFVHAPSERGVVRVEHLSTRYWATRYVGARRIATTGTIRTK